MNWLHVYARLLRCRSLAWECTGHLLCSLALWAFSKGREADECAQIVARRAGVR